MSGPSDVFSSLRISSIRYEPPSSPQERISIDIISKSIHPINILTKKGEYTYPYTVTVVEKPKEPNTGFYAGGIFEQSTIGLPRRRQTGIARTFEQVKNDGAKLVPIETMYLNLEWCLAPEIKMPYCEEQDVKHLKKNIDLAIAHFDESTPTLESILKENLKKWQALGKENPENFDEKAQKEFSTDIEHAIALRAEILKKVAENKASTANENP